MLTIPNTFYTHTTKSGHNLGGMVENLLNYYFEISEETINRFRHEPNGTHLKFEHLSEKDRYSTTLGGHKKAGFRITYLSENRYQCTVVKKNTSIIKNDLIRYLSRQVILRDLLPIYFEYLNDPSKHRFLLHYIELSLPTVKELLVRFLIATEKEEISLDEEVINFIEMFYLFVSNLDTPTDSIQKLYVYGPSLNSNIPIDKIARKIRKKKESFLFSLGLINKQVFLKKDVIPFVKMLSQISRQALLDDSPQSIYRNLPSFTLMFDLLS